MKMLEKRGRLGGKRKGFTLIELLIVMVILAILAGIVIISIGGVIGRGHATAYNADREQIEAAVAEFMTRPSDAAYNHTIGEVPITAANATAVNGSEVIPGELYYTVAICPMLTSSFPKGILKEVPSTVHSDNGAASGANAEMNVSVCLNQCTGSYEWLTTQTGDVASICHGADCTLPGGEDGFRDAYP